MFLTAETGKAQMKSAWVITQERTRHSKEVVGILSARKSPRKIKEYIEWLYALLHSSPSTHFEMAKYSSPVTPCEAEFDQTNTGIPVADTIRCGYNPYLVARLAKSVALVDADSEQPILRWTEPCRLVCDPRSPHQIVEKITGMATQARVHLPLIGLK